MHWLLPNLRLNALRERHQERGSADGYETGLNDEATYRSQAILDSYGGNGVENYTVVQ
jgi:hypothetical protein